MAGATSAPVVGVDESHGRYIGIMLVSVFRLEGFRKIVDKSLESLKNFSCGLKFSHHNKETSILNG